MDGFDELVTSLLDSDALKGAFKKKLAMELSIPVSSIVDIYIGSYVVDGLLIQELIVEFQGVEISKNKLMKLPFKSIYENTIVFEVGDIFL